MKYKLIVIFSIITIIGLISSSVNTGGLLLNDNHQTTNISTNEVGNSFETDIKLVSSTYNYSTQEDFTIDNETEYVPYWVMNFDIIRKIELKVQSDTTLKLNVTSIIKLDNAYQRKNNLETGPSNLGIIYFDGEDNIVYEENSSSFHVNYERTINTETGNYTQIKNPYGASYYEVRVFYDNYKSREIWRYTYNDYNFVNEIDTIASSYFMPDAKNWSVGQDPFQGDVIFDNMVVTNSVSYQGYDSWQYETDTIPSGFSTFEYYTKYEKSTGLFLQDYYYAVKDGDHSYLVNITLVDVDDVLDNRIPEIIPNIETETMEYNDTQDLIWNIEELHPDKYDLIINGELIASDTYNQVADISYKFNATKLGEFNFTIVATDQVDNEYSLSTIITVEDTIVPEIIVPENLKISNTTDKNLEFQISDNTNGTIELFKNGTSLLEQEFVRFSNITFSLDNLEEGYHNFTLVVEDIGGNMISETVFVTFSTDDREGTTQLPINFYFIAVSLTMIAINIRSKRREL